MIQSKTQVWYVFPYSQLWIKARMKKFKKKLKQFTKSNTCIPLILLQLAKHLITHFYFYVELQITQKSIHLTKYIRGEYLIKHFAVLHSNGILKSLIKRCSRAINRFRRLNRQFFDFFLHTSFKKQWRISPLIQHNPSNGILMDQ